MVRDLVGEYPIEVWELIAHRNPKTGVKCTGGHLEVERAPKQFHQHCPECGERVNLVYCGQRKN